MEVINSQSGQNYTELNPKSQKLSGNTLAQEIESERISPVVTGNQKSGEVAEKNLAESNAQNPQEINGTADVLGIIREDNELESALSEVESFLKMQNRDLSFTIDDKTQRSIVTVKDAESGDVIRQIPSEEVLKLAERIQELQQDIGSRVGVLFSKQV